MVEMREIEDGLRAAGFRGVDLYFASIRHYEHRHKFDLTFKQRQDVARERGESWVSTPSTETPKDLIRQALEQIRDGHNDPRTLARDVLAAIAP